MISADGLQPHQVQRMYQELERQSAIKQMQWKPTEAKLNWDRSVLRALGLKVKLIDYKPEQNKAILAYACNFLNSKGTFGMVAERAVQSIPGYGKIRKKSLNNWATHKVKKKGGKPIHGEFEDLVTAECILHVIDTSNGEEELVVNANVAYSYGPSLPLQSSL